MYGSLSFVGLLRWVGLGLLLVGVLASMFCCCVCVLLFVMGLFVFSLMFGGVCFALMCGVVLGLWFGVVFCVVIFFCL